MIPQNKPTIGCEAIKAVSKVLTSNLLAQGLEVEKFENEFCTYLGLPEHHAVALYSGTTALFMALWPFIDANRIGMPVYAYSSLRNALGMVSVKPEYYKAEYEAKYGL